ncbi:MAG: hypothetical protein JNM62_13520 [Flavobacteriales bacterium]|nr:hypothetical protein [Flavobacteriales bacterium]
MLNERPPFTRRLNALFRLPLMLFLAPAFPSMGQGTTDHIPGKVYVIRVGPLVQEKLHLDQVMKDKVEPTLSNAQGMFGHMQGHFYGMQTAASGQWFIGYFHPERQEKMELMRDCDLLIWLFHGHDVQIIPLEATRSPMSDLLVTPKPR